MTPGGSFSESAQGARAGLVSTNRAGVAVLGQTAIVLVLWLVAISGMAGIASRLPARWNRDDFSHYYASALAMREGIDPYTTDLTPIAGRIGLDLGGIDRATYPPTFVLSFEPLTLMTPRVAYGVWQMMGAAMLAASLAMLLGDLRAIGPKVKWSLAAFAILYPPVADHFYYAQSQFVILLMMVLMIRFIERGRPVAAGAMLGAAALLRIYPVVMGGYLIARMRWRELGFAAATIAIGALATVLCVGLHRALDFREAVGFVRNDFWLLRPANVAAGSFVSRIFYYVMPSPLGPIAEAMRTAAAFAAPIAILIVTAIASFRAGAGTASERAAFSLWIAATILVAPTAWLHYMVLLFVPFAFIADDSASGESSRGSFRLVVISYLVIVSAMAALDAIPWPRTPHAILAEASFASLAIAYAAAYSWLRAMPRRSAVAQRTSRSVGRLCKLGAQVRDARRGG